MRRIVPLALVALLALGTFGCGDVHVHHRPHRRYHRVHHHSPPPRVVHVHTRPAPPPRVVHVHHHDRHPHGRRFDRHPGRGHGNGHGRHHARSDAELRLKAKGDNGSVDLRVRVDD